MDIPQLTEQVLFNCNLSDAHHAGVYSICGLAMRLRDLYKWEHGLAPWQEDEAAKVLSWIGIREEIWEGLLEADYQQLSILGNTFDPFETSSINNALRPYAIYYGAGYAHSLKPTFFLAKIRRSDRVAGHPVLYLGREYARDLLTLPAFAQDGEVVIRGDAGRMFLWDQMAYLSNSGRRALDFAAFSLRLPDARIETLRTHFERLLEVQQEIYLWHEIGELEETVFDRSTWRKIVAQFPHSVVALVCRTLKDLLADTGPKGVLTRLLHHRNAAGLGLYLAFGTGLNRMLTSELINAFDAFCTDRHWDRMIRALHPVREKVVAHTRNILELYHDTCHKNLKNEAAQHEIETYFHQHGWVKR